MNKTLDVSAVGLSCVDWIASAVAYAYLNRSPEAPPVSREDLRRMLAES